MAFFYFSFLCIVMLETERKQKMYKTWEINGRKYKR